MSSPADEVLATTVSSITLEDIGPKFSTFISPTTEISLNISTQDHENTQASSSASYLTTNSQTIETSTEHMARSSVNHHTRTSAILFRTTSAYQEDSTAHTSHIEHALTTGYLGLDRKDQIHGMNTIIIISSIILLITIFITCFIIYKWKLKFLSRYIFRNDMSSPIYRPSNMDDIQMFELENMTNV